jgi:hypothetical protein
VLVDGAEGAEGAECAEGAVGRRGFGEERGWARGEGGEPLLRGITYLHLRRSALRIIRTDKDCARLVILKL